MVRLCVSVVNILGEILCKNDLSANAQADLHRHCSHMLEHVVMKVMTSSRALHAGIGLHNRQRCMFMCISGMTDSLTSAIL